MQNTATLTRREHPTLEALPQWPLRTIAVRATIDERPHAIPVSAPLRAGDRRIVRGQRRPGRAFTLLSGGPTSCFRVLHERQAPPAGKPEPRPYPRVLRLRLEQGDVPRTKQRPGPGA